MRSKFLFSSESVSDGHPDKICDRISDRILDAFLARDPEARTAIETFVTMNSVVIGGEVRSRDPLSKDEISLSARDAIRAIGYEQDSFHWQKVRITNLVHGQSEDIAGGVDAKADTGKSEGAGDQGMMFGYACRETPALMPAPIFYAHRVMEDLAQARRGALKGILGPDAKTQLTLAYQDGKPHHAAQIVLSTQHLDPQLTPSDVRTLVEPIVFRALPKGWITRDTVWHVNPTGRFFIGGPQGDAGLTGRKIIVDTYGGAAPHGGGAFSGKDPTKVDRSAAYAARFLAKNLVAARLCDRCTVQISYAIGVSEPVALYLDFHGTGHLSETLVEGAIFDVLDLTPRGIRERLALNRPLYERTSSFGHFGREPDPDGGFSWERLDLATDLKALVSGAA